MPYTTSCKLSSSNTPLAADALLAGLGNLAHRQQEIQANDTRQQRRANRTMASREWLQAADDNPNLGSTINALTQQVCENDDDIQELVNLAGMVGNLANRQQRRPNNWQQKRANRTMGSKDWLRAAADNPNLGSSIMALAQQVGENEDNIAELVVAKEAAENIHTDNPHPVVDHINTNLIITRQLADDINKAVPEGEPPKSVADGSHFAAFRQWVRENDISEEESVRRVRKLANTVLQMVAQQNPSIAASKLIPCTTQYRFGMNRLVRLATAAATASTVVVYCILLYCISESK